MLSCENATVRLLPSCKLSRKLLPQCQLYYHHYHFLMTNPTNYQTSVRWKEELQSTGHLAWYFHSYSRRQLPQSQWVVQISFLIFFHSYHLHLQRLFLKRPAHSPDQGPARWSDNTRWWTPSLLRWCWCRGPPHPWTRRCPGIWRCLEPTRHHSRSFGRSVYKLVVGISRGVTGCEAGRASSLKGQSCCWFF